MIRSIPALFGGYASLLFGATTILLIAFGFSAGLSSGVEASTNESVTVTDQKQLIRDELPWDEIYQANESNPVTRAYVGPIKAMFFASKRSALYGVDVGSEHPGLARLVDDILIWAALLPVLFAVRLRWKQARRGFQ